MSNNKFKILSIDGGGIRGIFPAKFLQHFENDLGRSLHEEFDLICGTSTGGIIALAIAAGINTDEILNLYLEKGKLIFKKRTWLCKLLGLHDNRVLYNLLEDQFRIDGHDDLKMKDLRTSVCIPGYDITNGTPKVFKTPHHKCYKIDPDRYIKNVALATASAPTFFKPYNQEDLTSFNVKSPLLVDGGVFANNPTMIGILEARSAFKKDLHDIEVLSIGTGLKKYTEKDKSKRFTPLKYWLFNKNIFDLFLQSQSQLIEYQCKIMAQGICDQNLNRFKYNRIQFEMSKSEEVKIDSRKKSDFNYLIDKANHYYQNFTL